MTSLNVVYQLIYCVATYSAIGNIGLVNQCNEGTASKEVTLNRHSTYFNATPSNPFTNQSFILQAEQSLGHIICLCASQLSYYIVNLPRTVEEGVDEEVS